MCYLSLRTQRRHSPRIHSFSYCFLMPPIFHLGSSLHFGFNYCPCQPEADSNKFQLFLRIFLSSILSHLTAFWTFDLGYCTGMLNCSLYAPSTFHTRMDYTSVHLRVTFEFSLLYFLPIIPLKQLQILSFSPLKELVNLYLSLHRLIQRKGFYQFEFPVKTKFETGTLVQVVNW